MRDIIVVHKNYKYRTWFENFYKLLCDKFGFELRYTDHANIPSDARIVVAFAVPHWHWPNLMVDELSRLDPGIYLIGWMADIHCGDIVKANHKCREEMITMFDRYDLILSAHDTRMKGMYANYLDKYVYLPWGFATHERYMKFKINKKPTMRCLMVGAHGSKVYPLRNKIHNYAQKHKAIKSLRGGIPEDKYASVLHEYFCGIADIGHNNEVVQPKYFEIPAVGSLLLGRRTNLVDNLGFIPYEHYVPFTGGDVFDKANDIISNPAKYENIRIAGMEYVRKNHSVNNRMEIVFDLIENIYAEMERK